MVKAITRVSWLISPDKLVPYLWMGCWTAVYGPSFQMKKVRGVERSRPKRGTKRRGGSAGRKGGRKRRRLIASDPVPNVQLPSPELRFEVLMYRSERKAKYLGKLGQRYVRMLTNLGYSRLDSNKAKIAKSLLGVERQVKLLGEDPIVFRNSAKLRVSGQGIEVTDFVTVLDTLRRASMGRRAGTFVTENVFINFEPRAQGSSTSTEIPPLRPPRREKARQNVARAPLCRHCGMSPCLNPSKAPFCRPGSKEKGKSKGKSRNKP